MWIFSWYKYILQVEFFEGKQKYIYLYYSLRI